MKAIEKIKEYSWAIMLVLMVLLFFRQCGANRDIDKIQKDDRKTAAYIDSTFQTIKVLDVKVSEGITKDEVSKEMEQVMFQYLIYEDDLDKGKISLSDVKNKIDNDEK